MYCKAFLNRLLGEMKDSPSDSRLRSYKYSPSLVASLKTRTICSICRPLHRLHHAACQGLLVSITTLAAWLCIPRMYCTVVCRSICTVWLHPSACKGSFFSVPTIVVDVVLPHQFSLYPVSRRSTLSDAAPRSSAFSNDRSSSRRRIPVPAVAMFLYNTAQCSIDGLGIDLELLSQ